MDGMIYHYDVAIDPDTLPSKFNMKLIHHMQTLNSNIFTPQSVYDGKKNLFSSHLLSLGPSDSRQFDVPSPEGGGGGEGKRPPKMYKVKLTKAAEINSVVLQRFVEQQQSLDESVLTAIMALNVVIRMEPTQKYPFNVRSFYTPQGKQIVGGGLEFWRGYFQSLRPSIGRLIVNVDISSGMMYKAGPLIELCLDFLGRGPNQDLLATLPDRERLRLQKFIKGVKVQIKTKSSGPQKFRVVRGLSKEGADRFNFVGSDGAQTNVARYFREQLRETVRFPKVICAEVGKGAMYPLEFCIVPEGQIARRQVPPDITKKMVEFATMRPADRFRSIADGVRLLAYGQSAYVRQFGLNIETSQGPLAVDARVLNTPKLQYGQGSKDRFVSPRNGSWNMADKKFFKPMAIKNWVIIIYERQQRFRQDNARKMVDDFVHACGTVGMLIQDKNPIVKWEHGQGNIAAQIRAAGGECAKAKGGPPSLVVVVLPDGGDDIYKAVKHFGDIVMGVPTQCLKAPKVSRANIQYWANVLLKVNVKLGGINLVPEQATASILTDPNTPTIVMGADVMHPPPGSQEIPSYSALVSSVDSNVSKYIAVTDVQTRRVELIENLEQMCKSVIGKCMGYRKEVEKTNAPIKRVIFYRDGVSEGQFQQVLDHELPKIRDACKQFGFEPKITLIVVGKRHHMRFQPQDRDADRSGNCPAGTVIDKGIGHPTLFDFYLQSHGGLLGTSRSSHYSVLYDDNNFNSDTMHSLSFALCHLFARSTRSVSIPAPVYYADIVCSRAKFHYDPGLDISLSETATQDSENSALERYRSQFKPLNRNQEGMMYFM
jgi:eukaryotic translation initiation factor 2C